MRLQLNHSLNKFSKGDHPSKYCGASIVSEPIEAFERSFCTYESYFEEQTYLSTTNPIDSGGLERNAPGLRKLSPVIWS